MFKHDYFFALFALSVFCGLILIGGYFYSGSLLPSTQGAESAEATGIWIGWSIVAGIPATTFIWWMIWFWNRGRR